MKTHHITWPFAGLLLTTLAACGGGGGGGDTPASTTSAATQDVSLQFAASVGNTVVTCGSTLSSLGSSVVNARLRDLRFYLSNVRLVSSSGTEVPITLTPNDNQYGAGTNSAVLIALTSTQDGTTVCGQASDGSAATYTTLVGKVPPGSYVRLRATVGLPDALNHSDTMGTDTPAPLQNMAMGWSWQNGRKFIKLELDPTGGVTNADSSTASTYNVHIASTNCSGGNVATATCAKANMLAIDIALNPDGQQVALDLNEVFRGVNLSSNATGAVGCMSASDDSDCSTLFSNLGLNLSTGAVSGTQAVFRAIAR